VACPRLADGLRHDLASAPRQEAAVIGALVLAAARAVAIDIGLGLAAWVLLAIVVAAAWAAWHRRHPGQSPFRNRRGK
jgi:hypothetical protein